MDAEMTQVTNPEPLMVPPMAIQVETGAETYEALFKKFHHRIYSLCWRIAKDQMLAEDLTQDAKLQCFRKIHSFEGRSSFSTWFYRLAVNVCLMHLRRKNEAFNRSLARLDEPMETEQGEEVRREISEEDPMLRGSVDRLTLERLISDLPPGYRLIFVLHDIEGYQHNEIARILDCSVGNSKCQLHKARRKLRNMLSRRRCFTHSFRPPVIEVAIPTVKKIISQESETIVSNESESLNDVAAQAEPQPKKLRKLKKKTSASVDSNLVTQLDALIRDAEVEAKRISQDLSKLRRARKILTKEAV